MSTDSKMTNVIRSSQAISLMAMSGMVISPALSGIGAHFSDIPAVLIQMLVTVPSICMIPSSLAAAKIKEHFGYRQIYLTCLSVLLVCGLLPILCKNFVIMLVCRILIGLAIGLLTPVNTSMVTTCLPPEQRTRVLGLNNAMESIGGAFMVIVCGWLAAISWELCFVVYLFTLIPMGAVIFRFKEDFRSEVTTRKNTISFTGPIVMFTLILCIYMTFLNIFSTNISALILEKEIGSTFLSGIIVAIYLLAGFFCGLVYEKMDQLFGKHTLGVGILLCGIGHFLLYLAGGPALLILGSVISGYGMGQAIPAALNLVNEFSAPEEQTFHISLLLSGSRIGQFLTTLIYVPILTLFHMSVTGAYLTSAILIALLAVVVWVIRSRQR